MAAPASSLLNLSVFARRLGVGLRPLSINGAPHSMDRLRVVSPLLAECSSFQLPDRHATDFTHNTLQKAMLDTIAALNKLAAEAGVREVCLCRRYFTDGSQHKHISLAAQPNEFLRHGWTKCGSYEIRLFQARRGGISRNVYFTTKPCSPSDTFIVLLIWNDIQRIRLGWALQDDENG